MPVPEILRGAPVMPKSNDRSIIHTETNPLGTGMPMEGNWMGSNIPGPPNHADVLYWKRLREAAIARGEDPDAKVKAYQAKKKARNDKLRKMFGFKEGKSKEEKDNDDDEITLAGNRDDDEVTLGGNETAKDNNNHKYKYSFDKPQYFETGA